MTNHHYNLLTDIYNNVCKDLARQDGRRLPNYTDQLTAAAYTVKVYFEMLSEESDTAEKLDALEQTRKWQRAKEFELLGTVS